MKRRVLIIGLLMSTLTACWSKEIPANWTPYNSVTGKFKAKFPAKPTIAKQTDQTPVGDVLTTITSAATSWGVCTVTYSDLPSMASMFGPERLFDDTRDSILKDVGGVETGWTDIRQFGSGKQLSYKSPTLQGVCQIYFKKNRLYVADVRTNNKESAQMNNFFANWSIAN